MNANLTRPRTTNRNAGLCALMCRLMLFSFLFAMPLRPCLSQMPMTNTTVSPIPPDNVSILPVGSSRFPFVDSRGNAGKPIMVWAYRASDTSLRTAPILFVMHGVLRNGETYRDAWMAQAEKYHFLLLVPEFSADLYPSHAYNWGNMVGADEKTPVDESKWTFTAIENLFDYVRAKTGNVQRQYDIYGHSAGGQFVHRLALFLPHPRFHHAIAANAGYYTLPVVGEDPFPFSLAGTPRARDSSQQQAVVFQRELIVLLGTDDTDPNDPDLYHSPEADKQGLYRLARGQNFYRVAQEQAQHLKTRLRWRLETAPGVAHDNARMAPTAAELLYGPHH